MKKGRIFSGIQPTGVIHLGNYVGAIQQWVKLMHDYDCIYCIVDYHAMTLEYEVQTLRDNIREAAITLLACGLDPEHCTLFVQSRVPEHTELTWIFNCLSPIGDLERMTQFKEKSQQHREDINMGLLGYPVLQAADILIYKAGFVPVGEDQVQHVELTRRIARRFNNRFGETFPEPQEVLTPTSRIMGTDGKTKMSKSLNNYIGILESPEAIWEKLRTSVTDERRIRRTDPGDPGVCNLFTMHKVFSSPEDIARINRECRTAEIGCVECKKILFNNMMAHLEPIQQKARQLRDNPDAVLSALDEGAGRCKKMAEQVMQEVRAKTGIRQTVPTV
ncbi:MAG: tryptophan--tRNA ligase [Proteobacteria bacterium]|nr:tryptophan--tRNA ligase [Pseudomonadota bacterium]